MEFHLFWLIFIILILFFLGTLLLLKKGYKNYLSLIFLIRTKFGIKFIDKISKIKGLVFIADFAIVSCLSGIGALYLSTNKRTKNLGIIFLIFAIFTVILYSKILIPWQFDILTFIFIMLFSIFGFILIKKFSSPYINFVLFSLISFLIAKKGFLIAIPLFPLTMLQDNAMAVTISIFGIPAFVLGMLIIHAVEILFFNSTIPGVSPMIPKISNNEITFGFLGYDNINIPIIYGIIAINILLISHEFAHGILVRKHDIKIKSTGLLTFGIIPIGAFIEPDEDEFKKTESFKKTHVYVMGSYANFLVAFFAIILSLLILPFAFTPSEGIIVIDVVNNSPADGIIEKGTIIYAIDGNKINKTIPNLSPNKKITIETNKGNFTLTTIPDEKNLSKGYIGIYCAPNGEKNFLFFITEILKWIIFLNLMVGITNLMPINPFDGGKIVEELISTFNLNKKIVDKIIVSIFYIGLFSIIINILPLIYLIRP